MLNAFNRATKKVAPGAFAMLEILLATWNKEALYHEWKLPDGYQAHIKVLDQKIVRLEIDELDHYKMNTLVTVNAPLEFRLANIANVTHSIDAFVLREVIRYCSFSHEVLESYKLAINKELLTANRKTNSKINKHIKEINYYSINILEQYSITVLSKEILIKLLEEIDFALQTKKSFQVLTIHDCYGCHPNYMNDLRRNYNHILAGMHRSNILQDILRQLYHDKEYTLELFNDDFYDEIIENDYAIC